MGSGVTSRFGTGLPRGRHRARAALLTLVLAALAPLVGGAAASAARAQAAEPPAAHVEVSATTEAYVVQFYPLWFTYYQSQYSTRNRLVGPDRVSELYQIVVAINVDTLYASTFVDVAEQPIVVSIPATVGVYSVLNLDPYGTIFDSGSRRSRRTSRWRPRRTCSPAPTTPASCRLV